MSHQSSGSLEYDLPSDANTRAVFHETTEIKETEKGTMIVKPPRSYLPTLEPIPESF